MFRRRGGGGNDEPAVELSPRWRRPVEQATAARQQFEQLLASAPKGPTRDRLESLRATFDEAVRRVTEAATRAESGTAVASTLDLDGATAELKASRRELDTVRRAGGDTTLLEARAQAYAERHRAINEALNLAEDAGSRLDDLNTRLDTAVAQAATLVLRVGRDDDIDELDRELHQVVVGLAALDDALEDLGP